MLRVPSTGANLRRGGVRVGGRGREPTDAAGVGLRGGGIRGGGR
jgi:hypothetical protein